MASVSLTLGSNEYPLTVVDGTALTLSLSGPAGPAGPAGPNTVSTSTSTNLTGYIYGNGTTVGGATAATSAATANTLVLRNASGGVAVSTINNLAITAAANSTLTIDEDKGITLYDSITTEFGGYINTDAGGYIVTGVNGYIYTNGMGYIHTGVGGHIQTGDGGFISTTAGGSFATGTGNLTGPDTSGTIALTSDIVSSTGGNGAADAGKLVEFGAEGQITVSESVTFGDADYSGSFQFPAQYFVQLGSDINGEAAGDQSGYSVSLNAAGDRVAIGAPFNDGNGNNSGHVRVYGWDGSAWTQLGADIDGEAAGDQSGYSVSLNAAGDRVAIGAVLNDGTASNAGHVRVYEWDGSAWTQLGADIDGELSGDGANSGLSVSMNAAGDCVAIGAPFNDGNGNNSGHVRVYGWDGSAWTQLGADIDGEAAGDVSGLSVSINAVGDRVAIGAQYNDANGLSAGHVRIYEWNGSAWTQLGADIDGEAADDQSGYSVSLNAVGDRVAIGARLNDGFGSDAGHVRVYGEPTNLSYQWTLPQTNGTVVVSDNPLISKATVVQTANTVASRDDSGRLRATQLRLYGPTYYSQLNFSPSPTGDRSFTFPNESGTIAVTSISQTFTGLQQFSTRPRSSAALTPANTTELITLADGDSRYSQVFRAYSTLQPTSNSAALVDAVDITLDAGDYHIDAYLATFTPAGTLANTTLRLESSLTSAEFSGSDDYGSGTTTTSLTHLDIDQAIGTAFIRQSPTTGTIPTFSRRLTGILRLSGTSTFKLQFRQSVAGSNTITCRKGAYIIATKLQSITDSYDYTTSGGDFYVKSAQGRYSYL